MMRTSELPHWGDFDACRRFSNNDIAVVAWTFDSHLDGCLGFAVHQIDVNNKNNETILPAMARFANQTGDHLTTADAPIQKFWWKDLYAKPGGSYEYLIVPMGGTPGQPLTPLAGRCEARREEALETS